MSLGFCGSNLEETAMADTSIKMRYGLLRATKCIGCKVENDQRESLGKIEDLIIDQSEGHVAAAVLSFGGFLGMGEKLVAVPLSALTFDADEEKFILNIDKETLRNAPSFTQSSWPDLIDRVWAADIYSYFGYPPYWH
jgi:hypothetical protein